jgi:hypothetical protein
MPDLEPLPDRRGKGAIFLNCRKIGKSRFVGRPERRFVTGGGSKSICFPEG